jgi:hypothetical protein
VGDFNGDGIPDLAVNSPGDNGVRVFLGKGDGSFAPLSSSPVASGMNPVFVAAGDFNGDGVSDLVTVNAGNNSVGVMLDMAGNRTTLTAAPSPATFGATVAVTATVQPTVAGSPTPTGTVVVREGATTLASGPLVAGQLVFNTATLSIGNHILTASYSGDSNFIPSSAPALTQAVLQAATTTTLASSANPSTLGDTVTITATVTGAGTVPPTGRIIFLEGSDTLNNVSLTNGQASLAMPALSVGSHVFTAVYTGDTNYKSSQSASLTQTVNQANTTTTLSAAPNPVTFGQLVTLLATITSSRGTPTGTAVFYDGATVVGAVPFGTNGQATFTTSTLAVGSHTFTARYNGDSNFTASTSAAFTQTVSPGNSTTTFVSSANPLAYAQPVTFTATVSGFGGTPTGTVTFQEGDTLLGKSSLTAAGTATLTTNGFTGGNHTVIASYSGDRSFTPSSSPPLVQSVTPIDATVTLGASATTRIFGQDVTFTATVTGKGAGPTGKVTFLDGSTSLGVVPLDSNGQAVLGMASLGASDHKITAVYSGDSNYRATTSAALTETVQLAATFTTLGVSKEAVASGQAVDLIAQVKGTFVTPTGKVTFLDGGTPLAAVALDGNGQARYTMNSLMGGKHALTALYTGDGNSSPGSSPAVPVKVALPVQQETAFAIGLDNQVYGQRLDANGNPAGGYFLAVPGQVKSLQVGHDAGGRSLLFVIGLDDQVYRVKFDNNGNATTSYQLNVGGQVKSLSVANDPAGRAEAFVLGLDGQVSTQKFDTDGNATTGYNVVPGGYVKFLTVGPDFNGLPRVYVIGLDDQVYTQPVDANGNPAGIYGVVPGGTVKALAAGHDVNGVPQIFVIGLDDQVYTQRFDARGNAGGIYVVVPGGTVNAISVSYDAKGLTTLYVLGRDNQVYAQKFNTLGDPAGIYSLVQPGTVKSFSVSHDSRNNPELFIIGLDDQVYDDKLDANGTAVTSYALMQAGQVKAFRATA